MPKVTAEPSKERCQGSRPHTKSSQAFRISCPTRKCAAMPSAARNWSKFPNTCFSVYSSSCWVLWYSRIASREYGKTPWARLTCRKATGQIGGRKPSQARPAAARPSANKIAHPLGIDGGATRVLVGSGRRRARTFLIASHNPRPPVIL